MIKRRLQKSLREKLRLMFRRFDMLAIPAVALNFIAVKFILLGCDISVLMAGSSLT